MKGIWAVGQREAYEEMKPVYQSAKDLLFVDIVYLSLRPEETL